MYKHILVPTDGTKLSARAVRAAVDLAKTCGARITGVYVIPPYVPPVYSEGMLYVADIGPQRHKELMAKAAKKALDAVAAKRQTGRKRMTRVDPQLRIEVPEGQAGG